MNRVIGRSTVGLPPGFRFMPTDEELILHFLYPKATLSYSPNSNHPHSIIPDLPHPSFHDPTILYCKALRSEDNWYYFFTQLERDDDGVTHNGYWKQLLDSEQEPVFSSTVADARKIIGFKKYFVYQAPSGIQTNWIMHQYHLCNNPPTSHTKSSCPISDCSQWVLCRAYEREGIWYGDDCEDDQEEEEDDGDKNTELSSLDEMFLSIEDDLSDINCLNYY